MKADEKVTIEGSRGSHRVPGASRTAVEPWNTSDSPQGPLSSRRTFPDHINVDVSALKVGDTLHIGEIAAPEGVELLSDKKIPVFAVAAPVAAEAETATTCRGAEGGYCGGRPGDDKREEGTRGAAA